MSGIGPIRDSRNCCTFELQLFFARAPQPRLINRHCSGARARRLDELETIESQIGCQFVKAASLITLHERQSEHGEDDEVHNRAMDTSAGPRVSCLSSPPSRILAVAEEAVKYSLVSSSVIPASV